MLSAHELGPVRFGDTLRVLTVDRSLTARFDEDDYSPHGRCAIVRFASIPGARFIAEGPVGAKRGSLRVTAASVDASIETAIGVRAGQKASAVAKLKSYLGSPTLKARIEKSALAPFTRKSALVFVLKDEKVSEVRGGFIPAALYTEFTCEAW